MTAFVSEAASKLLTSLTDTRPRPGLHPIPGTTPLTIGAAVCPPLLYYVALLLLPPPPPPTVDTVAVKTLRNILATIASFLFFRLSLAYHVPQSIGLTYQLGLVGIYGGCRVLDAFFISPYLFNHIPRRVSYEHTFRHEDPDRASDDDDKEREWTDGGQTDPFYGKANMTGQIDALPNGHHHNSLPPKTKAPDPQQQQPRQRRGSMAASYHYISNTLSGPSPTPVYEQATSEEGWPHTWRARASWALQLELSMRGTGFTWTTADVRHTRKTWLPTARNRLHSIVVHVVPVLLISGGVIRHLYTTRLQHPNEPDFLFTGMTTTNPVGVNARPLAPRPTHPEVFDEFLTLPEQLLLTACLGAFLMSAFSLAHSMFAVVLSPLAPSPLAFFPPLYTTRVWSLTSVRGFWSFGWHRLFARLFLVWGVWPGEAVERALRRRFSPSLTSSSSSSQPEPKPRSITADVGKVLGGFLCSAFVHCFSVRGVLGGDWTAAAGEAWFFALNGAAVVLEGGVRRSVRRFRRSRGWPESAPWDAWVGRVWWLGVLLWTGRNFARGWVKSGLVREMAGL